MIRLSLQTTAAIALHATEQDWITFVQCQPPVGVWPIRIEGISGKRLIDKLTACTIYNPFDVFLVGLIEATGQLKAVETDIQNGFAEFEIHDGWYNPTHEVLTMIGTLAQEQLQLLLAKTQPGGLMSQPVGIDELAKQLGVSVPTVRRMVGDELIPFMRMGNRLRFVPEDVFASLRAQGKI